jgi:cytoskeletal protein RodZ
VVVFSGDRNQRGYLVRSLADEKKIRSVLKMFYFAVVGLAILIVAAILIWAVRPTLP